MTFISRLHPAIFITTAFMMGIWWLASFPETQFPIIIFIASIMIGIKSFKRKKTKLLFSTLLCFFFFLGSTLYFLQQKNHSELQEQICGKKWDLKGIITEKEKAKQGFAKHVLTIAISEIKKAETTEEWNKTEGNIHIYLQEKSTLNVGDCIELHNIFLKKPKNESFNQFLMKINIVATAFEKKLDCCVLSNSSWNFSKWISLKKEALYSSLSKKISPETFSLFSSIFFGNKNSGKYFFEKSKNQFKSWGILHFVARSGLHLMIFIFLWQFLFGFLPIPFTYKQFIFLALGIIYLFLSWASISFLRAIFIFFAYKIGPLFNARTNITHLLALIALCMLVLNPIQLLFLDFQLSFGMTFALVLFGQLQQKKRQLLKNC